MSDILDAGRLEDHPFPALAGAIFSEGRSGELALESGERRRSVWFLGGNPVAVTSEDPQDHLAQILLEHGKISVEDARRLAALPETRDGLGSVDFLAKDTLNWGVKFRFVNLCYDLFRWEEGDYAFHEGNPPKELFLLKVPAHSLIFKGVGHLGHGILLEAVPDEAAFGPGPVAAAEARYLGPEERALLDSCEPGRTVAEVLGEAGDGADQARRSIYALSCLGLISLTRAAATQPPAEAKSDAYGFLLEEPGAGGPPPIPAAGLPGTDAGEFTFGGEGSRREAEFTLPPLDLPCEPAPGTGLSASDFIGGEPLPETPGFDQDFSAGSGNPFASPAPAAGTKGGRAAAGPRVPSRGGKATGAGRGLRVPRLAGIALGALGAAALIGAAGWWWMSSEEAAPPPVKIAVKKPAPPAAPAVSPAPPTVAAVPPAVPAPPPAPVPAPVPAPAAPPAAAAAAPAGSAERYRNGLEVFRAGDLDGAATIWEALLSERHRGEFTILLLTACQPETIREAHQAFPSRALYLVGKKVNGRNCFRVCLETFASRETAARSLAGIPSTYRSAGASVRPIADVVSAGR